MAIIARGQITVAVVIDGANSVSIYIRSQFQPSTPTGTSPVGWNVLPSFFDDATKTTCFGLLWESSGLKNSDGTLTGNWSTPICKEPYDSNVLGRFPFTPGTGNQSPFTAYSSTDNIREAGLNPFGAMDVVWRGKSQISTGWCGGLQLSPQATLNNAKRYRFSCWFKRNTWSEGYMYFGLLGTSQSTASWTDNTNFYFWSITSASTTLQPDKWYLVVGYLYESTSTDAFVDVRAGVYDPATGLKIINPATAAFARQKAGTTLYGLRISQYNCSTTNPESRFWQPRIDLADGREPSIEELLKRNPLQPIVTISGDAVFKFLSGQSIPTVTSITLAANLANGLLTYQWQYCNVTTGAWTNISGATGMLYALTYNYSAWGNSPTLRMRCASTLNGITYTSNEITITKMYDGGKGDTGATGATGSAGTSGPGIVYRGTHSSTVIYYNNSLRRDIVKYGTTYYVYKGTNGVSGAWNAANWESFGAEFTSVATELLLAQLAYIENLGVKNLKTATSGQRVEITQAANSMAFYDNSQSYPVVEIKTTSDAVYMGQGSGILVKHPASNISINNGIMQRGSEGAGISVPILPWSQPETIAQNYIYQQYNNNYTGKYKTGQYIDISASQSTTSGTDKFNSIFATAGIFLQGEAPAFRSNNVLCGITAAGRVSSSGSLLSSWVITFMGGYLTSSRSSVGRYRISFSNTSYLYGASDYAVMFFPDGPNTANSSIGAYACTLARTSSYFDVYMADDATPNDCGFTFIVFLISKFF